MWLTRKGKTIEKRYRTLAAEIERSIAGGFNGNEEAAFRRNIGRLLETIHGEDDKAKASLKEAG